MQAVQRRSHHALLGSIVFSLAALAVVIPSSALASTWTEIGDAGESVEEADNTLGVGSLTEISGNLDLLNGSVDDVDLFEISIVDTSAFAVSVTADLTGDNDAVLWLFDSAGFIVGGAAFPDIFPGFDDRADPMGDCDRPSAPCLPEFFAGDMTGQPAGIYYLGFSLYETGPIVGPGFPLSGWERDPNPLQSGPYSLSLSGAEFAEIIPVPPALWLFGSALALLWHVRSRSGS